MPSQRGSEPVPLREEPGAVEDFGIHDAVRPLAEREVEHAPADGPADVAEQLVGPGDAVRGEQHVVELAEAVRPDDRLLGETVERRPGDPAGRSRASKRASSSTIPPRAVLIR